MIMSYVYSYRFQTFLPTLSYDIGAAAQHHPAHLIVIVEVSDM